MREVTRWKINLNREMINHAAAKRIAQLANNYVRTPEALEKLNYLNEVLACLFGLQVYPNLNEAQELVLHLSRRLVPDLANRAEQEEEAYQLLQAFLKLAELINIRLTVPDAENLPLASSV
ncbi:MAG: hypothetical protein HC913_10440 [Microscillaceae bacterium]|nr:hypothetical protein [Microscillaceae bacterium]